MTGEKAERFVRTREAHRDETGEDYVEAIAELIRSRGEARNKDLARMMGVSHVTVSRIVRRLDDAGLVIGETHRPIRLTRRGRRVAEAARRRHAVVVEFLRAIGVGARQAEIDAEGIEHHVSDQTIRALRRTIERLGGDGAGGPARPDRPRSGPPGPDGADRT